MDVDGSSDVVDKILVAGVMEGDVVECLVE